MLMQPQLPRPIQTVGGAPCFANLVRRRVTDRRTLHYNVRISTLQHAQSAGGSQGNNFDWFGLFKPKEKTPEKPSDDGPKYAAQSSGEQESETSSITVPKSTAAQGAGQQDSTANNTIAESWEAGTHDVDWEAAEKAKPDPIGYAIMALMFVGVFFLTTSIFRLAGSWRTSREPPEPQTTGVTKTSDSRKQTESGHAHKRDGLQTGVLPGYTSSELQEMQGHGGLGTSSQNAPSSQAGATQSGLQAGEKDQYDLVYVPGAGWVDLLETELADDEGSSQQAASTSRKQSNREEDSHSSSAAQQQGRDEGSAGSAAATTLAASPEEVVFETGRMHDELGTLLQDKEDVENLVDIASLLPAAQFEFIDASQRRSPQIADLHVAHRPDCEGPQADSGAEASHDAAKSLQNTEATSIGGSGMASGTSEQQSEQEQPHSSRDHAERADGIGGPGKESTVTGREDSLQNSERKISQDKSGSTQLEKQAARLGERFWGPDANPRQQQLSSRLQLPHVKVEAPSKHAIDGRTLQLPDDASLASLRARASVAVRASLAANEASQRAAAYSSASSSAASQAALSAERAATASSIAQQAAIQKSDRILQEAVARAEKAAAEARSAEKRAAEAAAHAAAHEEVSNTQAHVSEQAAERPAKEDPEVEARPRLMTRSRQKVSDAWYVGKSRGQRAGHKLMAWLSVSIVWLQGLWSKVVVLAVHLWDWAKTPFVKKVT